MWHFCGLSGGQHDGCLHKDKEKMSFGVPIMILNPCPHYKNKRNQSGLLSSLLNQQELQQPALGEQVLQLCCLHVSFLLRWMGGTHATLDNPPQLQRAGYECNGLSSLLHEKVAALFQQSWARMIKQHLEKKKINKKKVYIRHSDTANIKGGWARQGYLRQKKKS